MKRKLRAAEALNQILACARRSVEQGDGRISGILAEITPILELTRTDDYDRVVRATMEGLGIQRDEIGRILHVLDLPPLNRYARERPRKARKPKAPRRPTNDHPRCSRCERVALLDGAGVCVNRSRCSRQRVARPMADLGLPA